MGSACDVDELKQLILKINSERNPQSVRQLAVMVKQISGVSEETVFKAVLDLESAGKIRLSDRPILAVSSLKLYVKSREARWFRVTVAVAALTMVSIFAISAEMYPLSLLRSVLGTVLVLWLPGFTFIKALFPAKLPFGDSSDNLDLVERVALSFGLSLALTPLVGLVLNYTPWGIRLIPVTLSLLGLTLIFAVVALVREFQAKSPVLEP